jgi:anti-anti-sigma factor
MTENEPQYARGSVQGNVLAIEILAEQIRDDNTSYALRDEMVALVDQAKPDHIVLDFQRVNFVGCIGFLAFLSLRRSLKDGRIVICNFSDSIRKLFEICRLISKDPSAASPFLVEDSLDAALERCGG